MFNSDYLSFAGNAQVDFAEKPQIKISSFKKKMDI